MKPRRWTFATLRAAYEAHALKTASNLELYRRYATTGALSRAQVHARAWWRLSDVYLDAVIRPKAHPEIAQ